MRNTAWFLPIAILGAAMWAACATTTTDDGALGGAGGSKAGSGGAQSGGQAGKGGSSTGGSSTGGSNTGGSNTGGSNTGGSSTGGSNTGGSNTGGTGGANTGGTGGGSAGTGGSSSCKAITAASIKADPGYAFVEGVVSPNLDGTDTDQFTVELYEAGSFTQKAGTFDLSAGDDANYGTCVHCVLVRSDYPNDGSQPPTKVFYQESGSLEMVEVTSPPTGQFKAKLTNVKLIEVTVDPNDYSTTPVPGGECLTLASADINTAPATADAGTPCQTATECGNVNTMVCDPKTATCQPFGCDNGTKQCTSTEVCVSQDANASVGACYDKCTPMTGTECGANKACLSFGYDGTTGGCYAVGTGPANGACNPADSAVNSGCVAGYRCMTDTLTDGGTTSVCTQMCDYFGATPACAASGQFCWLGGYCATGAGDPAALGAPCTTQETFCAPDGKVHRGFCAQMDADATTEICTKICRISVPGDCTSPTTCQAVLSSGGVQIDDIGLCLP